MSIPHPGHSPGLLGNLRKSLIKPTKTSGMHNTANERLVRLVARMYYENGLSQPDIASSFNISQGTVSRFLKKAEEDGIIRTAVIPPPGTFVDLEEYLEDKYGLAQVIIGRAVINSEEAAREAAGAAAAHFLGGILRAGTVIGVASWSASLASMVDQMRPLWKISGCKVVQILGGVGHRSIEKRACYLVSRLAIMVQGEPHLLPAPGVVASKAAAILEQDPHVHETTALFNEIAVALLSIDSLEPSSWLFARGNAFSAQEIEHFAGKGAVGNVCLRFYDAAGDEVKDGSTGQVIGLDVERLKRIPTRVGVACGQRNREAILGALRGGWINILVTDQFTAMRLVIGSEPLVETSENNELESQPNNTTNIILDSDDE
jgi:DNA-binding transcriptional regulator LsrR (DeoR family)